MKYEFMISKTEAKLVIALIGLQYIYKLKYTPLTSTYSNTDKSSEN